MSRYAAADLIRWAGAVLQTAGVPPQDAQHTARLLVRSDQRGFGTHGMARLTSYLERLGDNSFNPRPRLDLQRKGAAWTLEADGALGQVVGMHVLDAALPYLQNEPLLWVSVHHTGHLGALGILALEAAEAGLVCLMGQRTPPLLGLPGFHRRAIGHNPFAFAAPAGAGRAPFVFDMACSVAARGHILLAAREGKPVPADWALDLQGAPTTDAQAAAAGMLQPTGGYKGMGLAMMIECMAAALGARPDAAASASMELTAGGAVGRERAFFLFMNPAVAGDAQAFTDYMQHWIDYYVESGDGHARVPGQRGGSMELGSSTEGISYPPGLDAELQRLAEKLGLPLSPQT